MGRYEVYNDRMQVNSLGKLYACIYRMLVQFLLGV